MILEEIEQGVNDTAEEAEVESPTTEETPSEQAPDTDAGDTGDTQDADAGEIQDEGPGPVPYERFREVNERAKTAADFEARLNFFEDVLSDPSVRAAAVQALESKKQGGASPADPVEARVQEIISQDLPGYTIDDLAPAELVAIRRSARAEVMTEAALQAQNRRAGEEQAQVYNDEILSLAQAAGVTLNNEQRGAVDRVATAMANGYAQMGLPVEPKALARQAFNASQSEPLKAQSVRRSRTAEVTSTKQEITAGRPGGAPTPPGEAPIEGTGRGVTEALYDRYFKS